MFAIFYFLIVFPTMKANLDKAKTGNANISLQRSDKYGMQICLAYHQTLQRGDQTDDLLHGTASTDTRSSAREYNP